MGKLRAKLTQRALQQRPGSQPGVGKQVGISRTTAATATVTSVTAGRISKSKSTKNAKKTKFPSNSNGATQAVRLMQQQISSSGAGGAGIRRFDSVIGSRGQDPLRKVLKTVPLKKERHKLKKDEFRKRMQVLQELEQEKKKATERSKTVIVGDMNPLLEALPEPPPAEEDSEDAGKKRKKAHLHQQDTGSQNPNPCKKLKMKRRQKEIAESLDYFATGLAALAAANKAQS